MIVNLSVSRGWYQPTLPGDSRLSFSPSNLSLSSSPDLKIKVRTFNYKYEDIRITNSTPGGAAEFGGSRLMREDVVVVTVEYRTGILGFLSDETKKLPGNIGLTDVVLALRWVKERVEDFGGDPNSVTLAGYGQGATIAHLLSLNHLTSSE